jgi:hypothetical protein
LAVFLLLAGCGGLIGAAVMVVPALFLALYLSEKLPWALGELIGLCVLLVSFAFVFLKSYTFLVRRIW